MRRLRLLLISVLAGIAVMGAAVASGAESDYDRCDRLHPYDGTQASDDAFYACLEAAADAELAGQDDPVAGQVIPAFETTKEGDTTHVGWHQLTDWDIAQAKCNLDNDCDDFERIYYETYGECIVDEKNCTDPHPGFSGGYQADAGCLSQGYVYFHDQISVWVDGKVRDFTAVYVLCPRVAGQLDKPDPLPNWNKAGQKYLRCSRDAHCVEGVGTG